MPTQAPTPARRRAEQLEDRLVEFAATCCEACHTGHHDVARTHITAQLVRSATSPAAHYAEACYAESRRDFAHKLRIAAKELRETRVWLRIAARLYGNNPTHAALVGECEQLIAIFVSSIKTAQRG
jgi:four helix bundle protein